MFEHKAEFILFDTRSGVMDLYQRQSWPVLNGIDLFTAHDELNDLGLKLTR